RTNHRGLSPFGRKEKTPSEKTPYGCQATRDGSKLDGTYRMSLHHQSPPIRRRSTAVQQRRLAASRECQPFNFLRTAPSNPRTPLPSRSRLDGSGTPV